MKMMIMIMAFCKSSTWLFADQLDPTFSSFFLSIFHFSSFFSNCLLVILFSLSRSLFLLKIFSEISFFLFRFSFFLFHFWTPAPQFLLLSFSLSSSEFFLKPETSVISFLRYPPVRCQKGRESSSHTVEAVFQLLRTILPNSP